MARLPPDTGLAWPFTMWDGHEWGPQEKLLWWRVQPIGDVQVNAVVSARSQSDLEIRRLPPDELTWTVVTDSLDMARREGRIQVYEEKILRVGVEPPRSFPSAHWWLVGPPPSPLPSPKPPPLPERWVYGRPIGDACVLGFTERSPPLDELPAGSWTRVLYTPDLELQAEGGMVELREQAPPPKPKPKRKPKPAQEEQPVRDTAGALADVAARIAKGQSRRGACKDVFAKYGYPSWQALEKASSPSRAKKRRRERG